MRYTWGSLPTTYNFTGQRLDGTGLLYYGARYYDPRIGRFLSADTLVQADAKNPTPYLPLAVSYTNPEILDQWNQLQRTRLQPKAQAPGTSPVLDPQFLNRYNYVRNNPLAYVDDSGHIAWWVVGGIAGGIGGFAAYAITHRDTFDWREAALWTAGGAVIGGTLGAGAQWVAGALGTEAAVTAGTAATTAGAAASSPAGQRAIDFLENQLPRVQHIMAQKHAWDRLVTLSGNALQDYRAIQPYLEQVMASEPVKTELTREGTQLLTFVARINGQEVVVKAVQLANGALQISDAWVQTR